MANFLCRSQLSRLYCHKPTLPMQFSKSGFALILRAFACELLRDPTQFLPKGCLKTGCVSEQLLTKNMPAAADAVAAERTFLPPRPPNRRICTIPRDGFDLKGSASQNQRGLSIIGLILFNGQRKYTGAASSTEKVQHPFTGTRKERQMFELQHELAKQWHLNLAPS